MYRNPVPCLLAFFLFISCNQAKQTPMTQNNQAPRIREEIWGTLKDGRTAHLYSMDNGKMKVVASDYGGIIDSLMMPDRQGHVSNIVLGYPSLDYCLNLKANYPYFGAIIGRYANRIRNGAFTLDGKDYHLARNNGTNSLHGGLVGFDKKLWKVTPGHSGDTSELEFTCTSRDMEEGFPGNLTVTVRYELTPDNDLILDYAATTDKPTILNLTNHSYFNLSDHPDSLIYDHELFLNADHFLPIDSNLIPTGEILDVQGTPMDFRTAKPIGRDIGEPSQQLKFAGGYDQTWVLNKKQMDALTLAARVRENSTGREIEVYTTQPGIQFYSGNFLKGLEGRDGTILTGREGFCLETHHFPDAPNVGYFPTPVLRPGQTYHQTTIFKFRNF